MSRRAIKITVDAKTTALVNGVPLRSSRRTVLTFPRSCLPLVKLLTPSQASEHWAIPPDAIKPNNRNSTWVP